jgi:hypothetical protein
MRAGITPKDRLPRSSAEMEVGDRELAAFGSTTHPSQQVITKHATQHRTDKRCRQPIPRQRDQLCAILFAKEMASNHSPIRIRSVAKCKEIPPNPQ